MTDLQEKNAHMTIETGSQVIGALVQLRIVEQYRRGNRHGSSSEQKSTGHGAGPFSKMHKEKESLTQETDMERRQTTTFAQIVGKKMKITYNARS